MQTAFVKVSDGMRKSKDGNIQIAALLCVTQYRHMAEDQATARDGVNGLLNGRNNSEADVQLVSQCTQGQTNWKPSFVK